MDGHGFTSSIAALSERIPLQFSGNEFQLDERMVSYKHLIEACRIRKVLLASDVLILTMRAYDVSQELMHDAVAQKDRLSIDVSDLRQEIENCRNDAAWTELPLSAKIRVLVKERLEQLQAANSQEK